MSSITFSPSGETFGIGKIVAIGANYTDHIEEMGLEPPEEPMVFLKPASSVIHAGEPIVHPDYSALMHHEVELVPESLGRPLDRPEFVLRRRVDPDPCTHDVNCYCIS